MKENTYVMSSPTSTAELSADIADLFNLDTQITPVAALPMRGDSADCTNDGCTGSCLSCGCKSAACQPSPK